MKLSSRNLVLVFIGGALGTLGRKYLGDIEGFLFVNLFVVNLLGAIAIGFFNGFSWFQTEARRAFFVTGLAGGFTTMSGLTLMFTTGTGQLVVLLQIALGVLLYLGANQLAKGLTRG